MKILEWIIKIFIFTLMNITTILCFSLNIFLLKYSLPAGLLFLIVSGYISYMYFKNFKKLFFEKGNY